MNSRQKILMVLAVGALVLTAFLITKRYSKSDVQDLAGLGTIGDVAAQETVRLLGGHGKVAVIFFDPAGLRLGGAELTLRAFEARMKTESQVKLVAVQKVAIREADFSTRAAELVRQQTGVDAVVLLSGLAPARGDDFTTLPERRPKLVSVLAFDRTDSRRLLEGGFLDLVIAERLEPAESATAPTPASPYLVVTPENAAELAPITAGSEQ